MVASLVVLAVSCVPHYDDFVGTEDSPPRNQPGDMAPDGTSGTDAITDVVLADWRTEDPFAGEALRCADAQPVDERTPEIEMMDIQPEVDLPQVCLLNNCSKDIHCTGCPDGRDTCLVAMNRCVACIPGGDATCKPGESCSEWGICAPNELTCPTDPVSGIPTIACQKNSDCLACSPKNQVCDASSHHCQACTETNTSHCLPSDICVNGECSPKCPTACELDNDCSFCGPADKSAHACNMHKCAECSLTWPCSAGNVCLPAGVCYPPCGIPGPVQGTCLADQDCYYCGDPKALGSYVCKKPINDPEGHGSCIPSATGCSDLGLGVAVLPQPWSDYTQACSNDSNCNNLSIDINVGKLIRDLAGVDEVLGIPIGDATVKYKMNQCAEIKITDSISCGVCVPCQKDIDCDPIQVDSVIVEIFKGNPLAQVAGLMLINMLWGDENPEHNLNMFCQPVGLGYGVCALCANPLQPCGKMDSTGSGKCEHDVCTPGSAMAPTCGACSKEICSYDTSCCEDEWDDQCIDSVELLCASGCYGTGGCSADICTNPDLSAQHPACGSCVEAVCNEDPFCCNKQSGAWDEYCVSGAATAPACLYQCGGACAHSECEGGGPLVASCSACASSVCGADSWCCETEWDANCVAEAEGDAACGCK